MIIRNWGARGSIPVSGPQYVKYGGDTTCLELRGADGSLLVVDAGTGIRRLGNHLMREGRFDLTMLFTHVHWDHSLGFPFFKPIYLPATNITVLGCPTKQGDMRTHLSKIMAGPYFPVRFDALPAQIRFDTACSLDSAFRVGTIDVTSIPLSHPNLGLGYRFTENGRSLVFLTDNELGHRHRGSATPEDYAAFARGADLLLHDAEYTDQEYAHTKTWGHSTWRMAVDLALAAEVGRFGLYHHNQDRDDAALDAIVDQCRAYAAAQGRPDLDVFAVSHQFETEL
ncbi:MAG: MBL fold metallo-hydrolase [Desulfovibrionaceae bacterium]|jgi:phosphoribosyl 1,2-cyclic phosphodiesterase|nr:MBL fold metallo-hydrolase [Desulfovibrionaceae bacterium]